MATATANNVGQITQVIGSTFDVEFDEAHLPGIYNAVKSISPARCSSTWAGAVSAVLLWEAPMD